MDLNTPSLGIFSTKGINDIVIETSEMKMNKRSRIVTPVKKEVKPKTPKKSPTKKD
jgi:hypothetical protein